MTTRDARGVSGLRSRHQNMALGEKPCRRLAFSCARMALAEHAGIAVEIKPLPPQIAGGLRKRAKRQIGLPGLEPELELSRVQRNRAHADVRRDGRDARNQGRQKPDHTDIRQQQAEAPIRTGRIEFGCRRAQAVGGSEKNTQPIGNVERLGRRLHRLAVAHE